MCRLLAALWLAVGLVVAADATAGETRPVDLALVLAVDASGSVDAHRFELQKQGYVEAFRDPRVLRAVRSGPHQAIAVTMVQWTGPSLQAPVLDWMRIEDASSAAAVSAAIAAAPRKLFRGGTSISGAIDYSVRLLAASGLEAERHVIDISGDGANNSGRLASTARDEAVAGGIVINGLPILALEPDLDAYYRDNVVGGPGSFVKAVDSFEHFGSAILEKLIAEIAGMTPEASNRQVAMQPAP
jgi:Protein of unknown function (DUF1194)